MKLTKIAILGLTPDKIGIGAHGAAEREVFVFRECGGGGESFDIFVDKGDGAFGAFDLVPDFGGEVVGNAF